ncbi:MAG: Dph6-related ATP pyrophosphatase [Thermodesulfobacteriota bacterium]
MTERALFTWSGGKDSALALYELQKGNGYKVVALLTTLTEDYDRISMHGVRSILLEHQANSLGLPIEKVYISKNSPNEEYEAKMREILQKYLTAGVSSVVFGDIFLEDLRKHREDSLAKIGMKAIFPIWKRDTVELAHEFIDLGFKAIITCIDSNVLDKAFVGRLYNQQFLSDLPSTVDPCGENGEFHSFVYDGPMFQKEVPYTKGEIVFRDNRYWYCDLM